MQQKNIVSCSTGLVLWALLLLTACTKTFLDLKPNKSRIVPATIDDFQAILNNDDFVYSWPAGTEVASDNGWVDYTTWQSLPTLTYRNLYIWNRDVFNDYDANDWSYTYINVLNANICLEGIEKITPPFSRLAEWQNVKGSALFYRGFAFYVLSQEFAKLYDSTTATKVPGIVLRLASDVNAKSVRSSVQETYDRIIKDLKESMQYLPVKPLYKTRPSKPAVYAMLARTYLSMRNYSEAAAWADSCLNIYSIVLDYNSLNTANSNPIPMYNAEVVFHSMANVDGYFFSPDNCRIDSVLYQSYDNNDIRKKAFFKVVKAPNTVTWCGSYEGSDYPFNGIATDELLLIKAECQARAGKVTEAMSTLNSLLIKRWKTGTFVPFTAANKEAALTLVLTERRKELLVRGLRWTDLRRLNTESGRETTLTRNLNNQVYKLLPGDARYTLPIPYSVISFSGIAQNE